MTAETTKAGRTFRLDDLTPAGLIPKKFPDLYTEKSWRWAVKQRKKNGLDRAFHKVGKKLFVDTPVLAECIIEQPCD